MTYHCLWCNNDILDFQEARTFLSKTIHNACWVKLVREFKREYGIDLNVRHRQESVEK